MASRYHHRHPLVSGLLGGPMPSMLPIVTSESFMAPRCQPDEHVEDFMAPRCHREQAWRFSVVGQFLTHYPIFKQLEKIASRTSWRPDAIARHRCRPRRRVERSRTSWRPDAIASSCPAVFFAHSCLRRGLHGAPMPSRTPRQGQSDRQRARPRRGLHGAPMPSRARVNGERPLQPPLSRTSWRPDAIARSPRVRGRAVQRRSRTSWRHDAIASSGSAGGGGRRRQVTVEDFMAPRCHRECADRSRAGPAPRVADCRGLHGAPMPSRDCVRVERCAVHRGVEDFMAPRCHRETRKHRPLVETV